MFERPTAVNSALSGNPRRLGLAYQACLSIASSIALQCHVHHVAFPPMEKEPKDREASVRHLLRRRAQRELQSSEYAKLYGESGAKHNLLTQVTISNVQHGRLLLGLDLPVNAEWLTTQGVNLPWRRDSRPKPTCACNRPRGKDLHLAICYRLWMHINMDAIEP